MRTHEDHIKMTEKRMKMSDSDCSSPSTYIPSISDSDEVLPEIHNGKEMKAREKRRTQPPSNCAKAPDFTTDAAINPCINNSEPLLQLPRLSVTTNSKQLNKDDKQSNGRQTLRLPTINGNNICRNDSRLALHRSITDLLDTEMELLDKVRHSPRKKRKKRHKYFLPLGEPGAHNTNNEINFS